MLLHQAPQRQRARAGRRLLQRVGKQAPALVEVAVEGAGADRPEAAQHVGGGLVGARVVAVAKRRHRLEAEVAHQRQHRPPARALEPGGAVDPRQRRCLVGSQLRQRPAQQQGHRDRIAARRGQRVAGRAEHGAQPAPRQGPHQARPLREQFVQPARLVGRQQGLEQHLPARKCRTRG
jgi:hypothetical protein